MEGTTPEPTPAPAPPASSPAAGAEEPASPSDLLLKVLGAIGTGIGILGFVTLFGGAVIWLRADKAELPATEAVAVLPNGVMVTTGASFLVPAALIGAGIVVVISLVHFSFRLPREASERGRRKEARETRLRAEAMGRDATAALQGAKATRSILTSLQEAHQAAVTMGAAERAAELKVQVDKEQVEAERLEMAAQAAASAAAAAKAKADNMVALSESKLAPTPLQLWVEMGLAGLVVFFAPLLLNGAICHVGFDWALLLLLVAGIGTAITLFVYSQTERYVWFGLAAFVSASVFLGTATFISTYRNPKMEPVAALRTGHAPVVGNFIADTSSNFYVGTFREDGKPPRMVVIPRMQLTELTIGPLLDPDVAHRRAIAMAIEECEQKIEAPTAPPPTATASTAPQGGEGKQAPEAPEGARQEGAEPQAATEMKNACTDDQLKALSDAAKEAAR